MRGPVECGKNDGARDVAKWHRSCGSHGSHTHIGRSLGLHSQATMAASEPMIFQLLITKPTGKTVFRSDAMALRTAHVRDNAASAVIFGFCGSGISREAGDVEVIAVSLTWWCISFAA